jgi:hypothetical protein
MVTTEAMFMPNSMGSASCGWHVISGGYRWENMLRLYSYNYNIGPMDLVSRLMIRQRSWAAAVLRLGANVTRLYFVISFNKRNLKIYFINKMGLLDLKCVSCFSLLIRRQWQYVPSKRRQTDIRLHGVLSQKTVLFDVSLCWSLIKQTAFPRTSDIYLWLYALYVGPWPLFQFLNPIHSW